MGGAAVSHMSNGDAAEQDYGVEDPSVKKNKPLARNIFDSSSDSNYDLDIESLLQGDFIEEETSKFLKESLGDFFFLQSNRDEIKSKMDLIMRGMKKEEKAADSLLIVEGESGTNLYVLEQGSLEVTINGSIIREMERGAIVGELALLYDAPRSATVRCKSNCVLWSLSREIFKKIQAVTANANQVQRGRWLVASPELSILSAIDLSRLVGVLQMVHFKEGDKIFEESVPSNQVVLIEKGHGYVTTSKEEVQSGDKASIDKELGILRPREGKRKSVEFMSAEQLGKYLQNQASDFLTEEEVEKSSIPTDKDIAKNNAVCEVYEGCIIGISVLKGKANMKDGWEWKKTDKGTGGSPPLTLVAGCDMNCLVFTVEVFENLFGPVAKTLSIASGMGKSSKRFDTEEKKELEFDKARFKTKYVLGSGSFGIVTLADYTFPDKTVVSYALKSLSKSNVIETGQLRHVIDERKILASMDCPFILKLFGTYQTPHQLVLVTEPLPCGDLWSIIYENGGVPPFHENGCIPYKLTAFYAASLAFALSHIHSKGVVFRDLKPENIMLNEKGYLKIIDFGFAKKVPFTKLDANTGELKVYAKTYTLCGTPEYLSPELIFNLGHNHASDIWALGVLVYEMLLTVTPFAPKRPDNVTELFTNIAMVKKNGLILSPRINQQAGTPSAGDLIIKLLKADPAERLGIPEASTGVILNHEFFSVLDLNALENGTLVPMFVPKKIQSHESISSLAPVKPYKGDDTLFTEF